MKGAVEQANSKYVLGFFIDFKGAFDYLLWDSVLQRLSEFGSRELNIWYSYCKERKACVV